MKYFTHSRQWIQDNYTLCHWLIMINLYILKHLNQLKFFCKNSAKNKKLYKITSKSYKFTFIVLSLKEDKRNTFSKGLAK